MPGLGLLHRVHRQTLNGLDRKLVKIRWQFGERVIEGVGGLSFTHEPGANREARDLATVVGAWLPDRALPPFLSIMEQR